MPWTASPCRSWTKEACTKLHDCQLLLHLPGKAGLSEGQPMRGLQCLHAVGCTMMLSCLSCWRMLQGYQCPAVDSLFPTQMFFSCSLKGEADPPGLCVAGSGPREPAGGGCQGPSAQQLVERSQEGQLRQACPARVPHPQVSSPIRPIRWVLSGGGRPGQMGHASGFVIKGEFRSTAWNGLHS